MRNVLRYGHFFVGIGVFLALVSGCGSRPRQGLVSGKITQSGKPLAHAMVVFVPASGIGAAGVTSEDGSYQLTSRGDNDGVRVGSCTVGIQSADPQKNPLAIPTRFRDAHSSGLHADVQPGSNRFDFDIPIQ